MNELTHSFPMFPFDPPALKQKTLDFMFSGGSKERIGKSWLNLHF